jgi:hypothetical protein
MSSKEHASSCLLKFSEHPSPSCLSNRERNKGPNRKKSLCFPVNLSATPKGSKKESFSSLFPFIRFPKIPKKSPRLPDNNCRIAPDSPRQFCRSTKR